jgi:hypothetical protein
MQLGQHIPMLLVLRRQGGKSVELELTPCPRSRILETLLAAGPIPA